MNSSRKICEYIKVKTPIIDTLKVIVILEVHCKGLWEKVLHRSHCQYFESVFK